VIFFQILIKEWVGGNARTMSASIDNAVRLVKQAIFQVYKHIAAVYFVK
jgi:hypothetical protein